MKTAHFCLKTCIESKRKNIPKIGLYVITLFCFLIAVTPVLWGQDPLRFEGEIQLLKQKTDSLWNGSKGALLFTGSSSIRMWEDLQDRFPHQRILNTGFGGSQATDLLYYLQPLVLDYKPNKVFIYEGDNDLAEGKKKVGEVIKTLEQISLELQKTNPDISIVLISAKPSISRWNLRGKYKRLNRKLERWASRDHTVDFVDVWNPMLTSKKLNASLFIDDGLHMNTSGYDIWEAALAPFITP